MLLNLTAIPSWLDPDNPIVDQEAYLTYSGLSFKINIQPESPTVTALTAGEYFATYHFFTTYSGLHPGWRLAIVGTNPLDIYEVRGIQKYNFGAGQHYEGTLQKDAQ